MRITIVPVLAALATTVTVSGCAAAAGAVGGGGAAEYVAQDSPSSAVLASVNRAATWTNEAFADLGIKQTSREVEDSGKTREISGKHGSDRIEVSLHAQPDGSTSIDVTARRNMAEYDTDYAQKILTRILSKQDG